MKGLFFILLFVSSLVWSQDKPAGSITFRSSANGLEMKWYTQSLVDYNGVNVFRKTEGADWEQINSSKILPLAEQSVNENDEIEFVNEIVKEKSNLSGLPLINSMVSTFKYQESAKILGIYFLDKKAKSGEFQYQVRSSSGLIIATSEMIDVAQILPPAVPVNFEVKQTKRKAKFNWDAAPMDYFAVNVYAKINGVVHKLNQYPLINSELESDGAKYNFEFKLEEKTKYELYVKSIGFFYEESAPTEVVVINVGDYTLPTQPLGLNYEQSGLNKVHLTWNQYQDSTAEFLYVLRGLDYDNLTPLASFPIAKSISSFTDSSALPGDYYYAIAGVDDYDNWNVSERIIIHIEDLTPPSIPFNLVGIADSGIAKISWDPVMAKDLKGYIVFRAGTSKENFKPMNAAPFQGTNFQFDLSMRTKSEFSFYVVSVDSSLNRSNPSVIITLKQPDYVAPIKPLIKNVVSSDTALVLYWLKNTEKDLSHYALYRKLAKDTVYELHADELVGEVFSDKYFDLEEVYQYHLIAVDSTGNRSERSNVFTVKAPSTQIGEVEEINVKSKYKKKKQMLKLSWEVPEDVLGSVIFIENAQGNYEQKTGMIKESKISIFEIESMSKLILKGYTKDGLQYQSKPLEIK